MCRPSRRSTRQASASHTPADDAAPSVGAAAVREPARPRSAEPQGDVTAQTRRAVQAWTAERSARTEFCFWYRVWNHFFRPSHPSLTGTSNETKDMPRKAYLSLMRPPSLRPTRGSDGGATEARRKSVGTAPRKSLFVRFMLGCRATAGRSSAQPTNSKPAPRRRRASRSIYMVGVEPNRGSLST